MTTQRRRHRAHGSDWGSGIGFILACILFVIAACWLIGFLLEMLAGPDSFPTIYERKV